MHLHKRHVTDAVTLTPAAPRKLALFIRATCTCTSAMKPRSLYHDHIVIASLDTNYHSTPHVEYNIGQRLIDGLLEGDRFELVLPECSHKQAGYTLQCCQCGEWKPITSGFYADRQGEPFKAYHCLWCRLHAIDATDILGAPLPNRPWLYR